MVNPHIPCFCFFKFFLLSYFSGLAEQSFSEGQEKASELQIRAFKFANKFSGC